MRARREQLRNASDAVKQVHRVKARLYRRTYRAKLKRIAATSASEQSELSAYSQEFDPNGLPVYSAAGEHQAQQYLEMMTARSLNSRLSANTDPPIQTIGQPSTLQTSETLSQSTSSDEEDENVYDDVEEERENSYDVVVDDEPVKELVVQGWPRSSPEELDGRARPHRKPKDVDDHGEEIVRRPLQNPQDRAQPTRRRMYIPGDLTWTAPD
ncbi:hypothetical protein R3P38DRAFT_2905267 [Favolaschia claudopus]|uniref:Uncharacterized protein n=1 Tax=Favolaschia claudopus TaxID=2862362 RepID=A0AAW0CH27_9AGAR